MSGRRNFTISELYCSHCGMMVTVPRKKNKQREKGHVKDLWCIHCKAITKHTEKRAMDHENPTFTENSIDYTNACI